MSGIACGSQVILCDLPVRYDTYSGCTHACAYCFSKKWNDITQVKCIYNEAALVKWILGKREPRTVWCDWNIPLHWGGVSDPFQPAEELHGASLKALGVFAGTQYPFVVSTKGVTVLTRAPYLERLGMCNVATQVSMMAPSYDSFEPGAPTFAERLAALPTLARHSKRLIIRLQPYVPGMREAVAEHFPAYRDAGVWGVTVEGMKTNRKQPGFTRLVGEFVPELEAMRGDVLRLREAAHKAGLRFYCAENRLRALGDSPLCCGVDGLEGFESNHSNLAHLGTHEAIQFRPKMLEVGTADCFITLCQTTAAFKTLKQHSYADLMDVARRSAKFRAVMNLPTGDDEPEPEKPTE